MTRRRDFMTMLGAAALGSALRPRAPSPDPRAPVRTLNRVGLELYSVRDAMHKDPDGTLAAVRAMGYTDVELLWSFGNFGRTTEQVRAALDHEGLRAPSEHISPISLFVGWNRGRGASRRHLARLPQRSRSHDPDRRQGAVRRVRGAHRPEGGAPPARRRQYGDRGRRSVRLFAALPRPVLELSS